MALDRHPYDRVFTAGVGLGDAPVGDGWSAFDQEHLWFHTPPRQVSTGDHVFALGAGRGSAVLGLYEVTRGGPLQNPKNPWQPDRWKWNIGVRALATVPPANRAPRRRCPSSTVNGRSRPRRAADR